MPVTKLISRLLGTKPDLKVDGTLHAKVNELDGVSIGCPIGTIVMWSGYTPPDGWWLCDGTGIKNGNEEIVIKESSDATYDTLIYLKLDYRSYNGSAYSDYYRVSGYVRSTDKDIVKNCADNMCLWLNVRDPHNYTSRKQFRVICWVDHLEGLQLYIDTSSNLLLPNFQQRFPIGYNDISRFDQIKKVYDIYYPTGDNINIYVDTSGKFNNIVGMIYRTVQVSFARKLVEFYNLAITISDSVIEDNTEYNTFLRDINEAIIFGLGSTSGELMHTLTTDEMPSHTHVSNFDTYSNAGAGSMTVENRFCYGHENPVQQSITSEITGGSKPHNNMPPSLAINFIIKYK